ncbi:hypothetical protein D1AOALGA4SA_11372 [Olavius algarvensis Delta 1 endosymbiont]|nr:hypothetical protein D1AOALGA4SA_11372 [Olavius algarvensis Delta 1 endosymbiont]
MNEKYDNLDWRVIRRKPELDANGDGKHERFTIYFLVNGQSLYEMLGVARLDLVSIFSPENQEWNQESAEVFLKTKESDLDNGRIILYVCFECGDIGCGAVTLKIVKTETEYTWSEFGYENDYDPEMTDLEF